MQVFVPLTIDYVTLGAALKRQIYDAPGGRAILWKGANACEFLYARIRASPRTAQRRSMLESDGELGLGVPLGDKCVNPISWKGIIAIDATPYLTPNLTLMFRVSDINLYDQQHQKSLIVGRGFDLIKDNFIPRFQTFKFDLRPADRGVSRARRGGRAARPGRAFQADARDRPWRRAGRRRARRYKSDAGTDRTAAACGRGRPRPRAR